MSVAVPLIMTQAGAQPTPPAVLLAQLIALVSATNPGYTANLPGSLIEDVSSTEIAGISEIDSARVEAVNSLTPFGSNAFLLSQLGVMLGVPIGLPVNTSVDVVFSGPPGFTIDIGFVVSDGTYQYIVQDNGVIGSGGTSPPLFAVATLPGSWAVPSGTVTQTITSIPTGITVTVDNPTAGTPGSGSETEESYRSRTLQANLAAAQGMTKFLKTLLGNVSGVQQRLISVRQQGANWEVIVGGGDPYQVANAIFHSLFNINNLVGSTLAVTGITNANPGVVTTNLNHGYATGQVAQMNGVVGPTTLNGTNFTVTVIDEKTFSIGINTTALPVYVSGGIVTPNLRNESVTIADFPDTYVITFVNPPQQTVAIAVSWGTTSTNFVSNAAISQAATPALIAYVNSIAAGQPMNLFVLQSTFQDAVANILSPNLLTTLTFAVSINGVGVSPSPGTGIIAGDPESYFLASTSTISVTEV